jgi:uncharacterized repeat protein (TIGR02543 family)
VGWYTQAGSGGSEFTESTAVTGSIMVYAKWTGETYTVTFMSNYVPDTVLYTKEVTVPATTIPITDFPANPARIGYNFGSWNTQPGGGGTPFTTSTAVTGNMTVYAQWNTYSYTVTFNNNGGDTAAVPAAKTVASPAVNVDTLPVPPARSGYTFVGWYTQADGGSEFTTMTTVSGNITVYARWTGETYTVTFKSNYDTNETLYTETVTVPATTIPIADFPANPSRSSYIFAGWNTRDDGGGTPFTATTTVNSNITVYAKWIGETYTVTFKSNYGENEILYTKTVTVPAITITGLPAAPARTGYNFGSWNTQANGGGSVFTASTAVSGNITVYAQWDTYSYTVTFNKNGGDTEADPVEKTVASPATNVVALPVPPSRSSYIFTGWNTHNDGNGTPFAESTAVTGNITVYAQWTGETYTVTFKSNYGANNTLDTKTVTVPVTAITGFPAAPSRLGYNFGGWNTQANGDGTVFTASTAVNASITVYAQWDTYSYTVTFNNNGGNTAAVPAAKTVASPAINVGSLPVPPSRSGYSFAGWNTHDDDGESEFTAATTVSGNITVYAQWTRAIITLNPDAGDGAFSQGTFTLSKNSNESQTITITGSGYTNPRWLVDGDLKGTAASITINAADYGIGGHNLSLIINKSGVTWSKDITFTVTN